jgi:hypothetical protein
MSVAEKENIDSIVVGLKQSLESTIQGLTAFLESLKKSGMPNAVNGYRQLQAVLIQQRLWAQNNSRRELDPFFQSIAQISADIDSILAPYVSVMCQLKDLDKLDRMEFSTTPLVSDAEEKATTAKSFHFPQRKETAKILGLILIHGQLSTANLATLSRIKIDNLRKRLEELVKAGVIHRIGRGRGLTYSLSKDYINKESS